MAAVAAVLSLATTIGPPLFNLIAGLVHKQAPVLEAAHGAGTGPVKLTDLTAFVMSALQAAAVSGAIPKGIIPSDDVVGVIVQAIVSSMKLAGLLDAAPSTLALTPGALVPVGSQSLVLKAGGSVLISVGV